MENKEEIMNLYNTLKNVLHNDNRVRMQAEANLKQYLAAPEKLLIYLVKIMQSSSEDYIRKLSSVLFKQYMGLNEAIKAWSAIHTTEQEEIKQQIIETLKKETDLKVSKQLCRAITELARIIFRSKKKWPELEELIMIYIKGSDLMAEMAFRILDGLFSVDIDHYMENPQVLFSLLDAGFQRTYSGCLVTASISVCTILLRVEVKDVKSFYKYTVNMIRTIEVLFNEKNEDALHEFLGVISEVVDQMPSFFRKEYPLLCETLLKVASKKDYDNEKLRQMALEMLVIFIEHIPQLAKKYIHLFESLCLSIFDLTVSIEEEVEEEWLKPKEGYDSLEDLNPDDNVNFGIASFDRLMHTTKAKDIFPIVEKIVTLAIANTDWRYHNAGLMIIAQIGEYCESIEWIRNIVPILVSHISHTHPKVRFAALYAVGLISDYLYPDFQKVFSKELLGPMVAAIDDSVPRVQSHACAALTNFLEHVSTDIAMEVSPILLPKLIKIIREGISLSKENAMTCISSIAESAKQQFALYYNELIPFLFACVQQFSAREYHQLRGQTIECLTILMDSGERTAFSKYLQTLIDLMVNLQNEENPKGDPQHYYLITCWQRVCLYLGKDFVQYLPKIIDGFFKIGRSIPEMSTSSLQSGSIESVLREVNGKANNEIELTTTEIEVKEMALQMLKLFAFVLKEDYAEYVEETTKIVEPVLTFSVNTKLRKEAASILPDLLDCLKAANVAKESFIAVGRRYIHDLLNAHNKEADIETASIQILALKKLYRIIGHFMTQNDTKVMVAKILNYFKESDEQKDILHEYGDLEKEEDDEGNGGIQETIKAEEDYQKNLAYLLVAIANTHKEEFVSQVPIVLDTIVNPYLSSDKGYQKVALLVIAGLIECLTVEKLGVDLYKSFAAIFIEFTTRPDNELRQVACYGIGSLSKGGATIFGEIAAQCLTALAAAIEFKDDTKNKYTFNVARDSAISSIGKILKYQATTIPFPEIWPKWICYLPICTDTEEAKFAHEFVADTLINKPEIAVGPNGNLLGEILRIFIGIYRTGLISKEGKSNMVQALKELSKYPTIAALMNEIYEKSLTDENKETLRAMLQS